MLYTLQTKVCRVCKKELPLVCFSKNKSRKDGYQCECKECRKSISEVFRKKYAEKRKDNNIDINSNKYTKVCMRCGKEKPYTEFATQTYSKDGLQIYCKECHRIIKAENGVMSAYDKFNIQQLLEKEIKFKYLEEFLKASIALKVNGKVLIQLALEEYLVSKGFLELQELKFGDEIVFVLRNREIKGKFVGRMNCGEYVVLEQDGSVRFVKERPKPIR